MANIVYVPILKWRQGEYRALRDLAPAVVAALLPLMEIPPVPWDWKNDSHAETLDEHLSDIPEQFEKHWLSSGCIAVDLPYIDPGDRLAGGIHPITRLFDEFRSRGVRAIPVTYLQSAPAYTAAARAAVAQDGRGSLVRIVDADFADPQFAANLTAHVAALGLSPADVDLVIDLGAVAAGTEARTALAALAQLAAVPSPAAWRTLTLASGAFPSDLSCCTAGAMNEIARTDWRMWNTVRARSGGLARVPLFGDYAVAHPELNEVDPRTMNRAASIRYTADDKWLAPKGRSVKKHGTSQYGVLCQQLVADRRFAGAGFSAGDRYIAGVAAGTDGPGSATTWRQMPTNHHLTMVVHQLQAVTSPTVSRAPMMPATNGV